MVVLRPIVLRAVDEHPCRSGVNLAIQTARDLISPAGGTAGSVHGARLTRGARRFPGSSSLWLPHLFRLAMRRRPASRAGR